MQIRINDTGDALIGVLGRDETREWDWGHGFTRPELRAQMRRALKRRGVATGRIVSSAAIGSLLLCTVVTHG